MMPNRSEDELMCFAGLLNALDDLRTTYPWFSLDGAISCGGDLMARVFYSDTEPGPLFKEFDGDVRS